VLRHLLHISSIIIGINLCIQFSSCTKEPILLPDNTTIETNLPVDLCQLNAEATDFYHEDAARLALQLAIADGMEYNDISIPDTYYEPLLQAFNAVYKATNLPVRDSIINNYAIHTLAKPFLNTLYLNVNDNAAWVQNLINNNLNTGYQQFDELASACKLRVDNYDSEQKLVTLTSDEQLNIHSVTEQMILMNDVLMVQQAHENTDGNNIEARIYPNYIELTFSLGYDNCISNCDKRRYWMFRVQKADCSVVFVEAFGDPAP